MTNRDALCQAPTAPRQHGGDQHTAPQRSVRPAWSRQIGWSIVLLITLGTMQPAWAAKCLFISSYHQGYAWSDGVERGVRAGLGNRCTLKQFDMDTKRHKDIESVQQKALEARILIEFWQPDVVITADDNAAKHIIKPFYKDHVIPFVFCGINWTVKEYGFPYSNVTGMIEVAPIHPLFEKAKALLPKHKNGFYLGANTLTEHKNLTRFEETAARHGVQLIHRLVSTQTAWLEAFYEAQQYDFVILGSNSGINDWDAEEMHEIVPRLSQRLSLTNHGWMMSYAMLGLTKVPEEHGEWAAKTALHILDGIPPANIPIVPNRKWDIWLNTPLLDAAGIQLPKRLLQKGKKVY